MGVATPVVLQKKPAVPFKLAYKFVLLFLVVYFARPEDWIPGLHLLHPAKVVGIVAILAVAAGIGSMKRKPWPREFICLTLLLVQMFLASLFSSVWRGGALGVSRDFAYVVPMILVICLAVNTLPRLRRILFWQAVSIAVIAAVAVVKFRQAGGRLEGVLNGNYSNPNDLALTIVLAIPICLAFLLRAKRGLTKFIWLGCIGVMTYAVVLTASRAGILAFGLAIVVCLWQFSIKGRYRYLLIVFGGLAVLALVTSGSTLKTRFEAIFNPAEGGAAWGSAQQRNMLLKKSIVVTLEHPIFGLGPGNFTVASGVWHVTHNTYTQISSETGLPGFFLYMMILWCAWDNLRRIRRLTRGRNYAEIGLFTTAILASFAAFLVGSFFASEGYQYFTYFLVAYTTALYQIAKEARQSESVASDAVAPVSNQGAPTEDPYSTIPEIPDRVFS